MSDDVRAFSAERSLRNPGLCRIRTLDGQGNFVSGIDITVRCSMRKADEIAQALNIAWTMGHSAGYQARRAQEQEEPCSPSSSTR